MREKVDCRNATLFSAGMSFFIVGNSPYVAEVKNSLKSFQQSLFWIVCFIERFSYSGLFSVAFLLEVYFLFVFFME